MNITVLPGDSRDPHGLKFIRGTCHLTFRASIRDYDLGSLDDLFGGSCEWMSHPSIYLSLVLSECNRMSRLSLEEIEHEPPPRDFLKLWRHDLHQYQQHFAKRV